MKSKKLLISAIAILIFVLLGGSQKDLDQMVTLIQSPTPTPIKSEPTSKSPQTLGTNDEKLYLVTKIIDGDTIQIEGGQKVRYIGIDTPELKDSECFAKEARDKNKELVEGKKVTLQKDVSETDRYGRLLRFVYTENGEFVNDILVKEGYATVSTYPPDVAKQELFKTSQQDAVASNHGLWGAGCALSPTH